VTVVIAVVLVTVAVVLVVFARSRAGKGSKVSNAPPSTVHNPLHNPLQNTGMVTSHGTKASLSSFPAGVDGDGAGDDSAYLDVTSSTAPTDATV
jgi:hypothetical protein